MTSTTTDRRRNIVQHSPEDGGLEKEEDERYGAYESISNPQIIDETTESDTATLSDVDTGIITASHDSRVTGILPSTLKISVSPPPPSRVRRTTQQSRSLAGEKEPPLVSTTIEPHMKEIKRDDVFSSNSTTSFDNAQNNNNNNPTGQPRNGNQKEELEPEPSLAAVEAGDVQVTDHLSLFSSRLSEALKNRSNSISLPKLLPIPQWTSLYLDNLHPNGHHYVIHQHDHPLAGPHYDLRLQFSESSSVSWAIMYGLPGNPNSKRLNRNATETRVHCFWNHLIETGSARTGSMIIWDTGVYEILPYSETKKRKRVAYETEDSRSEGEELSHSHGDLQPKRVPSENEKLREAFQNRKIKIRLHGTKLPPNYTISMRISHQEDSIARHKAHIAQTQKKPPRRRRARVLTASSKHERGPSSTPSSTSSGSESESSANRSSLSRFRETSESKSLKDDRQERDEEEGTGAASVSDEEDVDEKVRSTNAYPGAVNSIGSIHQRRWFLTFDRVNSGFELVTDPKDGSRKWVRKRRETESRLHLSDHDHDRPLDDDEGFLGFKPFYVRGPEIERSVVTGRTGGEVLADEGVVGFVPRKGWRAVLE